MKRIVSTLSFIFLISFSTAVSQTSGIPYYGIQTHFGQGRPDLDSLLFMIKDAGIGSIRDEVYWHEIETQKDSFKFLPSHDAYIQGALQRGIKPLIILDYGNSLYSSSAGTPRDSASREAFGRYCKAVVSRYAPLGVKHYEIWNEPNLCVPGFCPWNPGPNPSEYFELLKVAYKACKLVDSTVYVVGCATSPLDEPETSQKIPGVVFISRVFSLGGGKYMDAVSFHQYPIGRLPEQWVPYEVGRVQAVVGTKPMWITEIGYPTSTKFPQITEIYQANIIARTYLLGRSIQKLERISWYDLQNDCTDPANPECRYGILREDRSPKPAYYALKTVAAVIGSKPLRSMYSSNSEYVMTFGTPDNLTTAFWHENGQSTRTVDVSGKNHLIVDRDGTKKYFIMSDSIVTVTLAQSPQYIIPLATSPKLKSFQIRPKSAALDSQQNLTAKVSGVDTSGLPVEIASMMVSWKYIGSGGYIDSSGVFHATGIGSGKLIGSLQGFSDTMTVSIVAAAGIYTIEDFTTADNWTVSTVNLDSAKTAFSVSSIQASSGGTSGRLDYSFIFKSAISSTKYYAMLKTSMPIPGKPDSIFIDYYGIGQPHVLEVRLIDADGEYFSKTAADQPARWTNEWRPVKINLKAFGSALDYPVILDRITVYTVPSPIVADSLFSGSVYLDNVRLKYFTPPAYVVRENNPEHFELHQNYPNPFNPTTVISFVISRSSKVTLKIFNTLGEEVATMLDEYLAAGKYRKEFNAATLPSGVYFYRIAAGEYTETKKLVFLQ